MSASARRHGAGRSDDARRPGDARLALGLALAAWLAPLPAFGHEFTMLDALAVFRANGTYQIDLTVDVDALALGAPPGADDARLARTLAALSDEQRQRAADQARGTIARRTRVRFDGVKAAPTISFPDRGAGLVENADPPTYFGVTARLSGRVPEQAQRFTFGASRAFHAVRLTIFEEATGRTLVLTLGPSEDSAPYVFGQPADGPGVAGPDRVGLAATYLALGFEHIVPKGMDHILFVLGLFLLATRLRPLIWQVTAFTAAHSVTLALSVYDVISLPSGLVEPLIAASIVYVAVENTLTSRLHPWRLGVVFAFGLLHGLGFAGVLAELGLPQEALVTALIAFNVGVELGQLAVIGLALLLVGWWRRRPWYRRWVTVPGSVAIGLLGGYWLVERCLSS